jgi:hypothetical protein
MRQWVLSFPYPLRFLFASQPAIMTGVLGIVYRAIATHLIHKAGYTQKTARYCQLNDIKSTQPIYGFSPLLPGDDLGAGHLLPFTKCSRAKLPIVTRSC